MIEGAGQRAGLAPPTDADIEIACIAHDLRNVLAVVQAAIDSLATGIADHVCDEGCDIAGYGLSGAVSMIGEDIGAIRTAVQRGAALTRRLMRPQDPVPQHTASFSIDAAVADIAGLLARLMPAGIRLQCDGRTGGASLALDRLDFERVVMNLVLNARDSMREGIVSLHTGQTTLLVAEPALAAIVPSGRYATIDVRDQGCGFPPDVMARIGRAYVTTKAAQGGTGLGLATVRRLVSGARGFLQIRSAPGLGTQMRLYFPWVAAEPSPAHVLLRSDQISPVSSAGGLHRGAVLLVDDDELLRPMAARALRQAGWAVIEAATAHMALAAMAELPAGTLAALVGDLALPDMDGLALIAKLRAQHGAARLPAVLISGYLPAWTALPDMAYLEKPCSMNELVAALEGVIVPGPIVG